MTKNKIWEEGFIFDYDSRGMVPSGGRKAQRAAEAGS